MRRIRRKFLGQFVVLHLSNGAVIRGRLVDGWRGWLHLASVSDLTEGEPRDLSGGFVAPLSDLKGIQVTA